MSRSQHPESAADPNLIANRSSPGYPPADNLEASTRQTGPSLRALYATPHPAVDPSGADQTVARRPVVDPAIPHCPRNPPEPPALPQAAGVPHRDLTGAAVLMFSGAGQGHSSDVSSYEEIGYRLDFSENFEPPVRRPVPRPVISTSSDFVDLRAELMILRSRNRSTIPLRRIPQLTYDPYARLRKAAIEMHSDPRGITRKDNQSVSYDLTMNAPGTGIRLSLFDPSRINDTAKHIVDRFVPLGIKGSKGLSDNIVLEISWPGISSYSSKVSIRRITDGQPANMLDLATEVVAAFECLIQRAESQVLDTDDVRPKLGSGGVTLNDIWLVKLYQMSGQHWYVHFEVPETFL